MTSQLPLANIQGIILRGYGHLTAACFLLLRVNDRHRAAPWIANLPITDAQTAALRHAAPGPFINVAFTHAGLSALQLDREVLEVFPREFVEGMGTDERARILGDVGTSAPSQWQWGVGITEPHVVLMIYSETDTSLAPLQAHYELAAQAAGMELITRLDTKLLTGRKEHFGFRDGIAQPAVQGARDIEPKGNTLPAGEIFLGCENAFGNTTHAPSSALAPFGLHGSYMVLRTLSQDVRGFWRYCRAQSGPHGAAADPITLASKMVGRWPSGAPLTLHPDCDPGPEFEDQDRFGYAKHDEDGLRCPFGSHVRRSNPRDSLVAESADKAVEVSNRHRIMRRGRAHGAPLVDPLDPALIVANLDTLTDDTDRGLHFISFQGNLERQFEFVQQQWCNNPKFAGLNSEADPLIGVHEVPTRVGVGVDPPVFTVPALPVRRRARDMQRFVHVRGGSYFFMPSLSAVRLLAR